MGLLIRNTNLLHLELQQYTLQQNNMKKIFAFIICLLIFSTASSQVRRNVDNLPTFDDRKLHFGFYLGLNQNDFKVNYRPSNFPTTTLEVKASAGFNVGLIADLRLHKNINLRFEPGLISNSKTLYFNNSPALLNQRDSVREIGSTYLHFPSVCAEFQHQWKV